MKKSITCFIRGLGGGGAEHQMAILIALLVEKGYDVTLTTFSNTEDHYKYPSSVKRVRLAQNKSTIIKILSIFKYFLFVKTDCVICFEQQNNFLCLIPLLFRRKIKVIAGERNTTYNEPDKIERILFNYLYKRANYIVPNSHTQAKYIVNAVPAYANKVISIINYTDLELFKATDLPLGKVLKIAIFARFEKQKNCIPFIEMLSELIHNTNREFHVDWYGIHHFKNDTLAEYFDKFQARLNELKIEEYFSIKQPAKKVYEVMPQYDVICLPSLYEGFSNSVAEGITAGRPMVVSDVSDNSLMVKDGLNGFLFNPTDVNSMVVVFKKLFKLSGDELRKMGNESRMNAERLFNKEVFVGSYIKLIES